MDYRREFCAMIKKHHLTIVDAARICNRSTSSITQYKAGRIHVPREVMDRLKKYAGWLKAGRETDAVANADSLFKLLNQVVKRQEEFFSEQRHNQAVTEGKIIGRIEAVEKKLQEGQLGNFPHEAVRGAPPLTIHAPSAEGEKG